jgi:hypothetical protein
MTRKNINRLIGYGILVFVAGFAGGLAWSRYIQLLMPVGSIFTFIGVVYFLIDLDLNEEFPNARMDDIDDVLRYFWNYIVLKFWTSIFVFWMIVMLLMLPIRGFLLTGSN